MSFMFISNLMHSINLEIMQISHYIKFQTCSTQVLTKMIYDYFIFHILMLIQLFWNSTNKYEYINNSYYKRIYSSNWPIKPSVIKLFILKYGAVIWQIRKCSMTPFKPLCNFWQLVWSNNVVKCLYENFE